MSALPQGHRNQPTGDYTHVGPNRRYTTVAAALADASDGDSILIDPGSYAGFTIYPRKFIHIEGSGQPEFNPITKLLVGGTIITGKIDLLDSVGSSLNNLGVDVSAINYNAIDTGSLVSSEQHRLEQRFTHLTINCNPSVDYGTNVAHGIRVQGGSHFDISNVRIYGGSHGIAIRGSYANISNCYIENGLSTAIIIKAIAQTGNAEYVNISNVVSNNTRWQSGGGVMLEAFDTSKARFINITNVQVIKAAIPSFYVKKRAGGAIIEHINISNSLAIGQYSNLASFYVNANYVTLTNCQVISPFSATAAFSSTGTNNVCVNEVIYPATLTKTGFTSSNIIGRKINVGNGGELTIVSGVVTVTSFFHSVDTEGDAVSDDLTTIQGGIAGDLLILRTVNDDRDVVLKHGSTLYLKGATDRTLGNTSDTIILLCKQSGEWMEI